MEQYGIKRKLTKIFISSGVIFICRKVATTGQQNPDFISPTFGMNSDWLKEQ